MPVPAVSKDSLIKYCGDIILKNHPHTKFGQCSVCGKKVQLWTIRGGQMKSNNVLAHAVTHFHLSLFRCHYCDYSTSTEDLIQLHLKQVHEVVAHANFNFTNLTEKYGSEILELIEKCFGKPKIVYW